MRCSIVEAERDDICRGDAIGRVCGVVQSAEAEVDEHDVGCALRLDVMW